MRAPPVYLAAPLGSDLEALAELERACHGRPWTLDQLRSDLERDGLRVLRGTQGIVAYCSVRRVVDELHVDNLTVAPDWQRRGLGGRLLERILHLGRCSGARVVFLEVRSGNRAARALYAAHGFEPYAVRRAYYTAPREDAVLMRRFLAAGAVP